MTAALIIAILAGLWLAVAILAVAVLDYVERSDGRAD